MYQKRFKFDEDLHNEFKMHTKNMISEIPKKCERRVEGRIIRTMQPNSKSICGFLNSAGGRIYLGVDDAGEVLGLNLTAFQIDHIILSLHRTLQLFNPPVPTHLVKLKLIHLTNGPKVTDTNENVQDDSDVCANFKGTLEHVIGGNYCYCWSSSHRKQRYLIIIDVKKSENNVTYQNEEGLVYKRRNGSNRLVSIDIFRQYASSRRIRQPVPLPSYEKKSYFEKLYEKFVKLLY